MERDSRGREMKTKSVGFSGSRVKLSQERYGDLFNKLDNFKKEGYAFFRHGDCIGSDEIAHGFALKLGFSIILHPPIISFKRAFCKNTTIVNPTKPFLIRNREIVDNSDILIAMPKNPKEEELRSGTWQTIRYARKRGREIFII